METSTNSTPSMENILQMKDELSEDEFKTKIIKWFKDRGLLANLRTHMRYQMITYLRETQIGNVLAEKTLQKSVLSKERTIHFLVAEYLLHNQYYYSLSILVSEVSFLNIFPDMTAIQKSMTSISSNPSHETIHKQFRFDKNDVIDFLQSLGIFQNSLEAKQICKFYVKNPSYPLLSIILRILMERMIIPSSDSSDKSIEIESCNDNETIDCKWNSVVYTIIKKDLLKGSNIYVLRDHIVRFFINEFNKFRNDIDEKQKIEFNKLRNIIENEFECKEMQMKKNLLELEQKFNKELNYTTNMVSGKDEIIKKLRNEVKKFDSLKEYFQKLKQKYVKEEESKKQYKETAQLLKQDVSKLQENLKKEKEFDMKKDKIISTLHEDIKTLHKDLDSKLKSYEKEIIELKAANNKLNQEIDQEKSAKVLIQVQHQQEISKSNALLTEINELKTKNRTLENYLNELNKRSDELNRQFHNTMKSLKLIDQIQTLGSETHSNLRVSEVKSVGTSESTATSITEMLNETEKRFKNLQVETQLIEDNYNKTINKSPVRFLDLWRATRLAANQNDSILNKQPLNDHNLTEFNQCSKFICETLQNNKPENELIWLNQKEIEIEPILETPQSDVTPLFDELHSNILSSFHNFHSTVLEVSRDIKTFVESTSKLSDNINVPQMVNNVHQKNKTNLIQKELDIAVQHNSFHEIPIEDNEFDVTTDFITKYVSSSGDDLLQSQDNETIPEKSINIQIPTKTSLFMPTKSIQSESKGIENHDIIFKFEENSNKHRNAEKPKVDVHETSSMGIIYDNINENSNLENIQETKKLDSFQENIKVENDNNPKENQDQFYNQQIDDNIQETRCEYLIEQVEISTPKQCENVKYSEEGQIKKRSFIESVKKKSSRKPCQDIPRQCHLKDADKSISNSSRISVIKSILSDSKRDPSYSPPLIFESKIPNNSTNLIQNVVHELVNGESSSTSILVSSIIDEKSNGDKNLEKSIHLLEKISIEDLQTGSPASEQSISPISTGFDNKNDDFWM